MQAKDFGVWQNGWFPGGEGGRRRQVVARSGIKDSMEGDASQHGFEGNGRCPLLYPILDKQLAFMTGRMAYVRMKICRQG